MENKPEVFNDLLREAEISPRDVLLLRHAPTKEKTLRKRLKWLASEKPAVFNAYQQTQNDRVQKMMEKKSGSGYVASFIGHEPGKAVFVGIYSIKGTEKLAPTDCLRKPAYKEMERFAEKCLAAEDSREFLLWFDLSLTKHCSLLNGKLIIDWPGEKAWCRYADRNKLEVLEILDESALDTAMPR
ncbi:MAG: hypothetical protein ACC613_09180 [Synergistales bacterium]